MKIQQLTTNKKTYPVAITQKKNKIRMSLKSVTETKELLKTSTNLENDFSQIKLKKLQKV